MARTLRTIDDLSREGLIEPDEELARVAKIYPIAVTPEMAALAVSAVDPVGRQFLPSKDELHTAPEELADPVGDEIRSPVKGIVHRYPDRVLLKPTHSCPVYCRFCFRRAMVGPEGERLSPSELEAALEYVRSHREIWEVIVTGGDPLMLSPRRVGIISEGIAAIAHVKVVRWHSRVPVVDPLRITPDLVRALTAAGKASWLAVHCNHPDELTVAAQSALARLADAGVVLVSQTVLLRGVNDDARVLEALMRRFVELGIRPYYLHQLDHAPGTAHFRVPIAEGQAIMRTLRGRLSGIAQPLYVLDIPGGHGKVPIGPRYIEDALGTVTDPAGEQHSVRDHR